MVSIGNILFSSSVHGLFGNNTSKSIYGRNNIRHAIVLSGGGIDSFAATKAWLMLPTALKSFDDDEDFEKETRITYLIVDYGQDTYATEYICTVEQAQMFKDEGVKTDIVIMEDKFTNEFLNNPLNNRGQQRENAKNKAIDYKDNDDYVSNRNARFLFAAAGLAEVHVVDTIIVGAVGGVNQDNSAKFFEAAYETMLNSNRDNFPNIYAPFVLLTKATVPMFLREYGITGEQYCTTSCFDSNVFYDSDRPQVVQCGMCRSCASLKQAYKFSGIKDPYIYKEEYELLNKKIKKRAINVS